MRHTRTHTPLYFSGVKCKTVRVHISEWVASELWLKLAHIPVCNSQPETHTNITYNTCSSSSVICSFLSGALIFFLLCDRTIMGISVCVLHDPHQGTRATPVLNQTISHSCLHANCAVSTATQAVLSKEKWRVWYEWRSERVMWGQRGFLIHKCSNYEIWSHFVHRVLC